MIGTVAGLVTAKSDVVVVVGTPVSVVVVVEVVVVVTDGVGGSLGFIDSLKP